MGLEALWVQVTGLLDSWSFRLVYVLLVLVLTSVIARSFNYILKRYFHYSSMHLKIDKTRFSLMSKLITVLIYIIGIAIAASAIPPLKTLSVSLLTGAGVLAAVVGFASQEAMSNVIHGIFIAVFKPFSVGDRIKVNDDLGDVEDINLRHTIIRNFQNQRIVIPNGVIGGGSIVNYSIGDPRICKHVEFGISYDADLNKAIRIIQEESMNSPYFLDTRTEDEKEQNKMPVPVYVMSFGESSIRLRAAVWTANPGDSFKLYTQLNKAVKFRFDAEGVEIPFPYRTLVFKSDLEDKKRQEQANYMNSLREKIKNHSSNDEEELSEIKTKKKSAKNSTKKSNKKIKSAKIKNSNTKNKTKTALEKQKLKNSRNSKKLKKNEQESSNEQSKETDVANVDLETQTISLLEKRIFTKNK